MYSGVSLPDDESPSIKLQERLLREAAALIITHQIPAFVSTSIVYMLYRRINCKYETNSPYVCLHMCVLQVGYCLQSNEAPMDGASLKQALHQRGINLRYLGHVIKAINQSEHKESLRHILVCLIYKIVKLKLVLTI